MARKQPQYPTTIVLIFSPMDEEDTGKGWYFEKRISGTGGFWPTSQLFATKEEALAAQSNNYIEWQS